MKESAKNQSSLECEEKATVNSGLKRPDCWYYSLKDQYLFLDSLEREMIAKMDISSEERECLNTCVGLAGLTRNNTGCCDLNIVENVFYLKILIGGDLLVRRFLAISDLWLYLSGSVEGATCLACQNC